MTKDKYIRFRNIDNENYKLKIEGSEDIKLFELKMVLDALELALTRMKADCGDEDIGVLKEFMPVDVTIFISGVKVKADLYDVHLSHVAAMVYATKKTIQNHKVKVQ